MPFIRTATNRPVSKSTADEIAAACGKAIPLIKGKTEDWLMVSIDGDKALYFKGSDAPCPLPRCRSSAAQATVNTMPSPPR